MEKKRIEIDTLYQLYSLGGICQSPDGSKGAFLKWNIDKEENRYKAEIWLWEPDEVRQLTSDVCGGQIYWQDERHILFEWLQKEDQPVWFCLADIRTGEISKAFSLDHLPHKLFPLKNGDYILQDQIHLQEPDDDCLVFDELPFAVNGRGHINGIRRQLQYYNKKKQLIHPISNSLTDVERWDVSENEERIVYTGRTSHGVLSQYSGVYEYTVETNQTQCLIDEGKYRIDGIRFWKNGIAIAASDQKRYGMDQNPAIYFIDKNGHFSQKAYWDGPATGSSVNSDTRYGTGSVFESDNDVLCVVTTEWEQSRLYLITNGCTTLFDTERIEPEFISVKNGICLMIGRKEQELQELYRIDLTSFLETGQTAPPVQLTCFSQTTLEKYAVGTPLYLPFSSDNGIPLQGWVLLPQNFNEKSSYPAVLHIHGGPKTVYGMGFHHEMQMLAGAGYFVFYCNPVGSDGRGDAFADIRGRYGKEDFQQIMKFTDLVLKEYPSIDPHRLGVMGGSYGGFMTNWIIGHTQRFAVAVSMRSMANMITVKTTTDIGYYSVFDHQRADINHRFEDLWRQSPIAYAACISTPTLFLHSEDDYRCWQAESRQMFGELKANGVETRLIIFKKENHDLSRSGKPSNRIRRLREICSWLDQHLKGNLQ